MARKSRMAAPAKEEPPIRAVYHTALYARISVEDQRKLESDSIGNQIALLKRWVSEHPEMELYDVYADRGESGANFQRAQFLRMMEDIRAKSVNCVVVKDLSRFGRNHIEVGNYIERIFPFLGIRFVAINDGYDSARTGLGGEPLTLPLKNLVNEFYARDISAKVVSQFRVKQQRGEFLGSIPPYGYLRWEQDPHKLVIDPQAALVVRAIFAWNAQGLGAYAIAGRLNSRGIDPPGKHRYLIGITKNEAYEEKKRWHKSAVERILKNPVYQGHMAQGKQKTSTFFSGKRLKIPQEEWVIVENTHMSIF